MSEMGETPATYGQRVQSHPVLMVTSQVKMRNSLELTLSYQGAISETIVYSRIGGEVEGNYNATTLLLERINGYAEKCRRPLRKADIDEVKGKYLWLGVKPEDVLEFLREYTSPSQHARKVNTALLAEYIEKQMENGDLCDWSVMLAGKNPTESTPLTVVGIQSGQLKRANHPEFPEEPATEPNAYRIRRLVSPDDEAWDLSKEQYQYALNLVKNSDKTKPGGPEIRVARDKSQAMLIIYPLDSQEYTAPLGSNKPYIGFAISFPGNKTDKPVKYRVNSVYQGQMDD